MHSRVCPRGPIKSRRACHPTWSLAEAISEGPVQFDLPARSSWEQDIFAFQKGRITGRVLGPDGEPLLGTYVNLYRLDQYKAGKSGSRQFPRATKSRGSLAAVRVLTPFARRLRSGV